MNQLVSINSPSLPALIAAAGECARTRFLEFFAANTSATRTPGGPMLELPRNFWHGA
jgi:hypothetical protein